MKYSISYERNRMFCTITQSSEKWQSCRNIQPETTCIQKCDLNGGHLSFLSLLSSIIIGYDKSLSSIIQHQCTSKDICLCATLRFDVLQTLIRSHSCAWKDAIFMPLHKFLLQSLIHHYHQLSPPSNVNATSVQRKLANFYRKKQKSALSNKNA